MTTPDTQTIVVPPINKRTRIPQAAIDDVVRQIAEKFKPNKIILFGSYAYGKPTQISDVDLLVVMKTDLKESQQEIHILKNIRYHFGVDLLVKTPESLQRRIELGDSFLKEIMQRGKVVYERPA
ncbi:MAG: nucleotidyltransferase domain-containing protein, partial [Anaerolineales bacterium]|nr:nucleotidyltransferase domain-containing protein [Anaerolineales bacterium]